MHEKSVLRLAVSRPVVRRALMFALLVGSLQICINHGDAILRGDIDGVRLIKMALTASVPYVVSTLSSVAATREERHSLRVPPPRTSAW